MALRRFLCDVVCLLILLAGIVEAGGDTKIFNVKEYGAKAGGDSDITEALVKAWKGACEYDGVGRVLIPKGTFLVGQVTLRGPCKGSTVVKVDGEVIAPDLEQFSSEGWISFQYINNFSLLGDGSFDGKGPAAWPHNLCPKQMKCKLLPTSLRFSFIKNGTIKGITSLDSKFFHIIIFECDGMDIQGIKITAPGDSPNTDGIHIGESKNIKITKSKIGTGDDCISLGPGAQNINISKVTCGPGHGISIGSLGKYSNEHDVAGIHVVNCTLTNTTNGVRIKSWESSPVGITASDIKFEDVIMNDVYNPIIIDQEYCPYTTSCERQHSEGVKIKGVTFKKIGGVSSSKVAVTLKCSKQRPCENVEMSEINLKYNGEEGGEPTASCSNVQVTCSNTPGPLTCSNS